MFMSSSGSRGVSVVGLVRLAGAQERVEDV
ncbi:hypothetical protein SAMN05421835_14236, partial [Amycolatopsis sacchari]